LQLLDFFRFVINTIHFDDCHGMVVDVEHIVGITRYINKAEAISGRVSVLLKKKTLSVINTFSLAPQ